jgi:glycine cleavage system protein P-like pyridoxal-binding family
VTCLRTSLQAGMSIVPVGVDAQGNVNIAELKQKAEQHK